MDSEGWKLLSYNNGAKSALMKFSSGGEDSAYSIMICDMVNIWRENLSDTAVKLRCKELNRRLEAPTESILEHIRESLLHHAANVLSVGEPTEILKLKLKNSFHGGIPFVWEFSCVKLEAKDCVQCFAEPLLKLTATLLNTNKELIKIINKKDAEIRDYKESGAKVSRPYLETVEFESKTFLENVRQSNDYVDAVTKDPLYIASDTALNELLTQVKNDSKCPALVRNNSSTATDSKAVSPQKNATIVGNPRKRGMRNVRKPPRGVEALSDSDTDVNDKTSITAPKRATDQEKVSKKKKAKDKRKRLF